MRRFTTFLALLVSFVVNSQCENPIFCNEANYCTLEVTPIVICPEFCTNYDYEITNMESIIGASTTIISNKCFRYIPLPGLGEGVVDVAFAYAIDVVGNCFSFKNYITITNDCEPTLTHNVELSEIEISNSFIQFKQTPYNGFYLTDVTGKVFKRGNLNSDDIVEINTLQTGIYFLVLQNKRQLATVKFFKD